MGITNLTPFTFQADIMNGVDPAPQDIALENGLFSQHKVRFFAYNQQVTDSLTTSIRQNARKAGVPVVGVYETMPTPGYNYQWWMLAEVHAIEKAVTSQTSRNCDDDTADDAARDLRVDQVSVSLGGRPVLDEVSFRSAPGSSPG